MNSETPKQWNWKSDDLAPRRKLRAAAARTYDSHRPSPVDLQDADIKVSPAQRAYLKVFDEWVRDWRTRDKDDDLKRRKDMAFNLMAVEAGLDMTQTREFKRIMKPSNLKPEEAQKVAEAKRRASMRQLRAA